MSELKLITAPDPFLRNKSLDVKDFNNDTKRFMDDMLATMYLNKGVGLAAVQVGVLKNIIVIDMHDLKNENEIERDNNFYPLFLMNPYVEKISQEKILATEGCLSLPEQRIDIARPESITIKYRDYNNLETTLVADGWLARAIQHEMDHLKGKLLIDYISFAKKDLITRRLLRIKKSKDL
jgi:peptide deformylase